MGTIENRKRPTDNSEPCTNVKSDSQRCTRFVVMPCSFKLALSNNHSRLRREYGGEARRLKIARPSVCLATPRFPLRQVLRTNGAAFANLRLGYETPPITPLRLETERQTDKAMDQVPRLGTPSRFGHAMGGQPSYDVNRQGGCQWKTKNADERRKIPLI